MSRELRQRIADALNWPVRQTYGFSLPTLREIVRAVDPDLAYELDMGIQSSTHLVQLDT